MRFIGMMICGEGEGDRKLAEVLNQWKGIIDDAIICQNKTDGKTKKIIKQSEFWTYDDDREWGNYQPQMKTDLLKKVAKLKPDWIFPKDADEIYGKHFNREEADKLAEKENQISWQFYFIQLWNDENHHYKGLAFWNVRMFKYYPRLGMEYLNKPLHCGLAPPAFYKLASDAPFLMLHYGLMKQEDRDKKIARYSQFDPNAKYKDKSYYEAITYKGIGASFDEEEWQEKVLGYCQKYPSAPKKYA